MVGERLPAEWAGPARAPLEVIVILSHTDGTKKVWHLTHGVKVDEHYAGLLHPSGLQFSYDLRITGVGTTIEEEP